MDSITLRVHFPIDHTGHITEHQELFNALTLMSDANKSKYKTELEFGVNSVSQVIDHFTLKPVELIAKELTYYSTEQYSHFVKGRVKLPSNHYDIGYFLNLERHFCDFSFSLPKFIYGHSVTQLLHNPHISSSSFRGWDSDLKTVTQDWYKIFHIAVRQFFDKIFIDCPINYKLVELVRIDFCFNQYFRDKNEAMYVLPLMANKANTGLRGKSGKNQNQQYKVDEVSINSFIIAGRNSYYKIYHKGTEFESVNGDKKKLIKINNDIAKRYKTTLTHFPQTKRPKPLFDVLSLQSEADRILRHEVRFFSKNMSYYFKKYVFRKNDLVWQNNKNLVSRLTSTLQNVEKAVNVSQNEKRLFKSTKKQLEQRHRFFLDADSDTKLNSIHGFEHYTNQFLSADLFNFLIDKFISMVHGAQVSEFPDWDKLKLAAIELNKQKLKDYQFKLTLPKIEHVQMTSVNAWKLNDVSSTKKNENKPEQLTLTSLKKIYDLVETYGSLDYLLDNNYISKRSYYRWRKTFKELNYNSSFSERKINVDTTYRSYFHSIRGFNYMTSYNTDYYYTYFSAMSEAYKKYF
jgi:hypothetical protein